MNDVAIALEHVDLLDRLDGLDVELLQRRLQLLVVGAGALVDLLDFSPGGALATVFAHTLAISDPECGYAMFVQTNVRGGTNASEAAREGVDSAGGSWIHIPYAFMLASVSSHHTA